MTPKEAYEMTEKKWKAIVGGNLDISPGSMTDCGLCLFAHKMAGQGPGEKVRCNAGHCPVPHIFGTACCFLPYIQRCSGYRLYCLPDLRSPVEYIMLARLVLDRLTSHKEQLIAEMERIGGEK